MGIDQLRQLQPRRARSRAGGAERELCAPRRADERDRAAAAAAGRRARGDEIEQPLGEALSIRKRPDAPRRVFLGIHADTVYGPDDPFQQVEQVDANTLRGPGVVDAKGGLAVMLVALERWSEARWRRASGGKF